MSGPGQLGIRALNAALFVACAYLTAGVLNQAAGAWLAPAEAAPVPAPRAAALERTPWSAREPILERNLFGAQVAGQAEPAPVEEEEDLEETKLPLRLLGTAASGDPALSRAAIADESGGDHQVVGVGDRLEGHSDVRVVGIDRRRVVLENGARREELRLEEDQQVASASRRAAPRRTRREPQRRLSSRLQELRERARQQDTSVARNAASLFSQARILPKYESGQMVGVQLNAIEPGSLYERFGFQDGDVITELNGISIDSPSASAQLLSELGDADSFEFTVNGERRTIPAEQVAEVLDQL